jgi:hypothetical protein
MLIVTDEPRSGFQRSVSQPAEHEGQAGRLVGKNQPARNMAFALVATLIKILRCQWCRSMIRMISGIGIPSNQSKIGMTVSFRFRLRS